MIKLLYRKKEDNTNETSTLELYSRHDGVWLQSSNYNKNNDKFNFSAINLKSEDLLELSKHMYEQYNEILAKEMVE